jgi:hypothetical protein
VKIYIVTHSYVEDEKFTAFLDETNARHYAEQEGTHQTGRPYELLDPIEILDAPTNESMCQPRRLY